MKGLTNRVGAKQRRAELMKNAINDKGDDEGEQSAIQLLRYFNQRLDIIRSFL